MRSGLKRLFLLHILLAVLSLSAVCSKLAGGHPFLSGKFILWYGLCLGCLAVFALGWQQVIRKIPLIEAYASRSVTVIWGLIWSVVLFGEAVTPGKLAGVCLIAAGIVLFAYSARDGADRG